MSSVSDLWNGLQVELLLEVYFFNFHFGDFVKNAPKVDIDSYRILVKILNQTGPEK